MKEIDIIMKHLKEQHSWRLEESECGDSEVAESFDKLKNSIITEIKAEHPNYASDIVDAVSKA